VSPKRGPLLIINDIKVILSKYVCIFKDSMHVDLSMIDCLLKYVYFSLLIVWKFVNLSISQR